MIGARPPLEVAKACGAPTPKPDLAEIERTLRLLFSPGDVFELRALEVTEPLYRAPHTTSGYFEYDRISQVAGEAAKLAPRAKGVYVTANPCDPALLARAANRVRACGKGDPTTADHDVPARRCLLIDLDPTRPAGISSSDAEHALALALARAIREAQHSRGWPDPIVANSGNGAHLIYRIDLPRDDGGLVERCLKALAIEFGEDGVKVDTSVHNPARIWKLYGTLARKGDSTHDRPHRLARILESPAELVVVPRELLDALAAKAPVEEKSSKARSIAPRGAAPAGAKFDLHRWIKGHALNVEGPSTWKDGRRWVFGVCPWKPEHTNHSAYIVQLASGGIDAGCHHNGCSDKGWHDLRDVVEPGWRARGGAEVEKVDAPVDLAPPIEELPAEFPIEVFPSSLRAFASEAARALCASIDFIGAFMLVVAATAIGASRVLRLKPGYDEAPRIYLAAVAPPGETKSPALRLVMGPIHARQSALARKYGDEKDRYERDLEQYQDAVDARRSQGRRGGSPGQRPAKPQEPRFASLFTTDTTTEALAVLLRDNPRGQLLENDELTGWVLGLNQYKAGGRDRQFYLSAWSGAAIKVDRKGKPEPIIVQRHVVNILGCITPDCLDTLVADGGRADGLMDRIVFSAPSAVEQTWTEAAVSPESEAAWVDAVVRLYSLEPQQDENGQVRPRILGLTARARDAWAEQYSAHCAEMRGLSLTLRGPWSKLRAYAARFALVVHLLRLTCGEVVGEDVDEISIAAGWALAQYFGEHCRRVYRRMRVDPRNRQLEEVHAWVKKRGGACPLRDLYHEHVAGLTCAADTRELVDALIRRRWARLEKRPSAGGKGPEGEWLVLTAAESEATGDK